VGVASYLLIGFYYKKPSANIAAMKAFVVNRVGDFGFALGIFGLYFLTDSIKFDDIFAQTPELAETTLNFIGLEWNAANLLAILLFIGAMGKSAQLVLHTWLPDAMEGPTPVSALIHAATMVTAGVFLVCRMSPLMEYAPEAQSFIVFLGATTAFFAATVGLVQNDIKRVIAYSTCSQLGYMFVAAGVGVYSVAMFHLLTHAFFKAMLFLGAGSVIHGMHHEQDMRNYGGLRHKMPKTFWAMMIGTLAITGVGIPLLYIGFPVGFAGFVSKDAIIESAYAAMTHPAMMRMATIMRQHGPRRRARVRSLSIPTTMSCMRLTLCPNGSKCLRLLPCCLGLRWRIRCISAALIFRPNWPNSSGRFTTSCSTNGTLTSCTTLFS